MAKANVNGLMRAAESALALVVADGEPLPLSVRQTYCVFEREVKILDFGNLGGIAGLYLVPMGQDFFMQFRRKIL